MLLKNVFFEEIGHLKWAIFYFVTINACELLYRFQVTWQSLVGQWAILFCSRFYILYFRPSTFIDIHFWIFTASFFLTRRRLKKLIKCHSVRVFERYIGRFRVPLTLTLLIEQPKSFKTFEIFNIFEIQMKVMAFLN